jgi:CheY-like chemotaxis protein
LFDASIDLVMDLDPALKPIYADPAQIQQVILNLALNARDAMPQGGRLTIQTRNEIPPKEGSLSEPGPFVKLSIADTGTGMDPEIQKQVFDPFFTTKKGKGTGLGLTTVYGIVQQWKGQIHLQSAAGEGTVFSVFFPVHAGGTKKSSLPQQVPLVPDGTETILVTEDDPSVRKAVVRSLESFGYKVLEAGDGVEAIQQSWNYKGEIHLLLTDTVMPKLNGRHLAEELGPIRPKMKVIFISGYPKEILTRKGEIDPDIRLLTKPFAMEDMVREVRKVLDEKKK